MSTFWIDTADKNGDMLSLSVFPNGMMKDTYTFHGDSERFGRVEYDGLCFLEEVDTVCFESYTGKKALYASVRNNSHFWMMLANKEVRARLAVAVRVHIFCKLLSSSEMAAVCLQLCPNVETLTLKIQNVSDLSPQYVRQRISLPKLTELHATFDDQSRGTLRKKHSLLEFFADLNLSNFHLENAPLSVVLMQKMCSVHTKDVTLAKFSSEDLSLLLGSLDACNASLKSLKLVDGTVPEFLHSSRALDELKYLWLEKIGSEDARRIIGICDSHLKTLTFSRMGFSPEFNSFFVTRCPKLDTLRVYQNPEVILEFRKLCDLWQEQGRGQIKEVQFDKMCASYQQVIPLYLDEWDRKITQRVSIVPRYEEQECAHIVELEPEEEKGEESGAESNMSYDISDMSYNILE